MTQTRWTKEEIDRRFAEVLGDDADNSPGARKRRRILRAAHSLFLKQGYRKTSIDDVARKAEVAKGTVYLYFENKAQLLIAAIVLEKTALRGRVAPLFDGTIPKRDRLRHWIVLALTAARDLPLSTRLLTGDAELFAALEDAGSEDMASHQADGASFVLELIEDAAPGRLTDEEKRVRAETLVGVTFLAPSMLDPRFRGALSLDVYAATLAEMLVAGIAGRKRK